MKHVKTGWWGGKPTREERSEGNSGTTGAFLLASRPQTIVGRVKWGVEVRMHRNEEGTMRRGDR